MPKNNRLQGASLHKKGVSPELGCGAMETTTFCICPGEAKALWMSCEISRDLQGSETHTRNCAFSTQNGGPVHRHQNLPQARGNVHTLVQLVYLTGHTDTPVNAQGVPSIPGAPSRLAGAQAEAVLPSSTRTVHWQNSPKWLCDQTNGNLHAGVKKGHSCSTSKYPKSRAHALGA